MIENLYIFLGTLIICSMLVGLGFVLFVGYKVVTTPVWQMKENYHRNTRRPS